MDRKRIILDCDPGHDDAVAIILAAVNPNIDLLGITVSAGNQTVEKTKVNACRVLQWIGKTDIPVYPGCPRPIVREPYIADFIHGESGLDGPVFPPLTKMPEEDHGVNFIVKTLRESEGDVIVVTTGPMTNLAMAMRMAPGIVEKIKRIVVMGGSVANGNVTPAAEYNIWADAEAAYICFTSGRPITMVGLDVTRKVLCYPEIVERMERVGTGASKLFVDLMGHFCKTQKEVFGYDGGPLHDPVTIAYLIEPELIKTQQMNVTIEIKGENSYGRTNCDTFDFLGKPATADVAMDINVEGFWNLIERELARVD